MSSRRKIATEDFFATHPVFTLEEAARALLPPGGRAGTRERLKHHLRTGRLRRIAREVYAVVPRGLAPEGFVPDPFLAAAAVRPEGVFSHHGALELLGAAHSVWHEVTLYTSRRRTPLTVGAVTVRFLVHPRHLGSRKHRRLGTRTVERRGVLLTTTGPERTLVEGFRRPALTGGLDELVSSASGFPVLDLDLLVELLRRYDSRRLWAAVGWFLERFRQTFHVPGQILELCERHRPASALYMVRDLRGGKLVSRWNLVLPEFLLQNTEPDDRWSGLPRKGGC